MLRIYSKEELFMFNENATISNITEHVKKIISYSIRDKKKFDKKFMKAVCLYKKYEDDNLIIVLDDLNELFENALTYVKEHDNIELELAYCELDETSISSIEDFINVYIRETNETNLNSYKVPKFDCDDLEYTKDLLINAIRVYNPEEDVTVYLKKVIDYLP